MRVGSFVCFQHLNRHGVGRKLESPIRERADRDAVTLRGSKRPAASSRHSDRASASRN